MKFRTDFVTNSSSSAFIIAKEKLSDLQIKALLNYHIVATKLYNWSEEDAKFYNNCDWDVWGEGDYLCGFTSDDSFSMRSFMEEIGLNPYLANWGNYISEIEKPELSGDYLSERLKEILDDIED